MSSLCFNLSIAEPVLAIRVKVVSIKVCTAVISAAAALALVEEIETDEEAFSEYLVFQYQIEYLGYF